MKNPIPFRPQVFAIRHYPRAELIAILTFANPDCSPRWIINTANHYLSEFRKDKRLPPTIPNLMLSFRCSEEDANQLQEAML